VANHINQILANNMFLMVKILAEHKSPKRTYFAIREIPEKFMKTELDPDHHPNVLTLY